MTERFEVDIDSERVYVDGAWYARDELAAQIKARIEAGDFRVAREGMALEQLDGEMAAIRVMEVRLDAGQAEALAKAASIVGRPPGSLVRDAVARLLAEIAEGKIPPPPPQVVTTPVTNPEEALGALPLTQRTAPAAPPTAEAPPEPGPGEAFLPPAGAAQDEGQADTTPGYQIYSAAGGAQPQEAPAPEPAPPPETAAPAEPAPPAPRPNAPGTAPLARIAPQRRAVVRNEPPKVVVDLGPPQRDEPASSKNREAQIERDWFNKR